MAEEAALRGPDIRSFLEEVLARTAPHLTAKEIMCAITLLRPKRPVILAMSSPRVLELDERQYGVGQGPCLTAATSGQIEHVTDIRKERRWLAFVATRTHTPTRSILAAAVGAQVSTAGTTTHFEP